MRIRRMTKVNTEFIKIFTSTIIKTTARNMKVIADSFVLSIKTVLDKQLYKWPPLSEKYAKEKERKKLDPRILIATGKYMNAIGVIRKTSREKGVTYSVGVEGTFETGPKDAPKKLSLELLGRWLEFGTAGRTIKTETGTKKIGGMPPREHWRPTWSALIRKLPIDSKKLKKDTIKEFKSAVRRTNLYKERTIGV